MYTLYYMCYTSIKTLKSKESLKKTKQILNRHGFIHFWTPFISSYTCSFYDFDFNGSCWVTDQAAYLKAYPINMKQKDTQASKDLPQNRSSWMRNENKGVAPCHTSSGTSPTEKVPETKILHSLKVVKTESFVPEMVWALLPTIWHMPLAEGPQISVCKKPALGKVYFLSIWLWDEPLAQPMVVV